jgi:carbon starvation protein CstA
MIEISDIITLPPLMMIHAIVLSAIALYMNYRWIMVSPIFFIITLVLAATGLNAVYSEFLGPLVIQDQGESYIYIAYSEFILVLIANIIGINFGIERYKMKKMSETTETEEDHAQVSPTS